MDLRISPTLLAHPDFAELVLLIAFEVERRDVIHHQRHGAVGPGGVTQTGLRELVAVVALLRPAQSGIQRVQMGSGSTDLLKHSDRVGLARRLDQPCQDHRFERLIAEHVEPELGVCPAQHLPQDLACRGDQSGPVPAGLTGSIQAEVEFVLTVVESLSGSLHQDREFTLIVG